MPTTTPPATADDRVVWRDWVLAAVVSLIPLWIFWSKLLAGGSLVGGDTFPYFMPQKVVIAESFAAGEWPLWHSRTGLGYPLHAESQGGVFYPTTQVLYRIFDVSTAYRANVLLHYWLAFVFAWRFGRCQQLGNAAALFAALVFVYGWAPVRISLEWSVIGTLWLPTTLWLTDRWVRCPSYRRLALLSFALGLHLLAGHFALAFINQLAVVSYVLLKSKLALWQRIVLPSVAIAGALFLASVQLLPTYELKLASQREGVQQEFDPAYGHLPPAYFSQVVASWWYWHTPEQKTNPTFAATPAAVAADTNAVEAHLYWGLIPVAALFVLLIWSMKKLLVPTKPSGSSSVEETAVPFAGGIVRCWFIIGICALVYSTGWLMPVTRHLPGFRYFMGPGRYSILCSLAGSLLSAAMLQQLVRHKAMRAVVFLLVGLVTAFDLKASSDVMTDAIVVSDDLLSYRTDSWVAKELATQPDARLLAPGPNVGNLFGVSCVPQYLGLGPALYYSEDLQLSTGPQKSDQRFPTTDQAGQMRQLGITHVLTTEPIVNASPDLAPPMSFPDPFLNRIWGRGSQPVYLYPMRPAGSRITSNPVVALQSATVSNRTNGSVTIDVQLSDSAVVVLRELMYPGWKVEVDGILATPIELPSQQRAVKVEAGRHQIRWVFRSTSFLAGAACSFAGLLVLLTLIAWPGRTTG